MKSKKKRAKSLFLIRDDLLIGVATRREQRAYSSPTRTRIRIALTQIGVATRRGWCQLLRGVGLSCASPKTSPKGH